MRTAITLGILPNGKAVLLHGPEVDLRAQKDKFKARDYEKLERFTEIQVWQSGHGFSHRHRVPAKPSTNGAKPPQAPPPPPPPPPQDALQQKLPSVREEISKVSEEDLRAKVAPEYKVDPAGKTREQLIDAILLAAGYKAPEPPK